MIEVTASSYRKGTRVIPAETTAASTLLLPVTGLSQQSLSWLVLHLRPWHFVVPLFKPCLRPWHFVVPLFKPCLRPWHFVVTVEMESHASLKLCNLCSASTVRTCIAGNFQQGKNFDYFVSSMKCQKFSRRIIFLQKILGNTVTRSINMFAHLFCAQ